MNLIAIETSGNIGSVAAAQDEVVLLERSFQKGMRHGRDLVPVLRDVTKAVGWKTSDIQLAAISIGPGSYTGLRIGVACVKTIAYVTGAQTVAVPTLDVLAQNAPTEFHAVCPVLDAKRKQVYAAIYRREGGALVRVCDDLLISPKELVQRLTNELQPPVFLLGDGLATYHTEFNCEGFVHAEENLWTARASVVARLGFRLFTSGQSHPWQTLTPRYLRRPEAEERWEERMKKQALK